MLFCYTDQSSATYVLDVVHNAQKCSVLQICLETFHLADICLICVVPFIFRNRRFLSFVFFLFPLFLCFARTVAAAAMVRELRTRQDALSQVFVFIPYLC